MIMEAIVSDRTDILSVDIEPDGLSFFPENIAVEQIAEDAEYKGLIPF
jgi:hypothetical protein